MAKQFSYDFERMLELLKIEQACVKRASGLDGNTEPCDRDCANCHLVQETEDLLDMYEKVIRLVSREVERKKREQGYKEEAKRRREMTQEEIYAEEERMRDCDYDNLLNRNDWN